MERQRYLDCVAGLLMIKIVLVHSLQYAGVSHSQSIELTSPLYFSMPWFFYKAGMFYHHKNEKEILIKGVKGLIIPFVIFSLIGAIFYFLRVYAHHNTSWNDYFISQIHQLFYDFSLYGNQPLWFLFVFFMVKLISNFFIGRVNLVLLMLICFFVPYALFNSTYDYPYYLASIPAGILFYLFGNLLKEKQYDAKSVIIATITYFISAILGWNLVDMHWNMCVSGNYLFWIPTSLAGIILFNNVFNYLPNIPLLEWLGKNTITIFLTHSIVLEVAISISKGVFAIYDTKWLILILMISELLFLPLFVKILSDRRLSWMEGR